MTARFDAIGLVVSDMAASVTFYRRLGFAFPEGPSGSRTPRPICRAASG